MNINKYFDHTLLGATPTKEQIDNLVYEAKRYAFASVCVNPSWVSYCKKALKGSDVKVCTVIGFPHGQNTIESKVFETKDAIKKGADEIDMVLNVSKLKAKDDDYIFEEINKVVKAAKKNIVKVIIETCYLTDEEKIRASKISVKAGANFVKTSTGFGTGGATKEDVKLMKDTVKDSAEVKASGGIRTLKDFNDMVEAGATRIGASKGIQIIKESQK